MEKIYYQTLKETLFHEKLENGLEVYLLPKIGFEKTYGLFSTRFGSIDTTFVPLGQKEMIKVEDGIAHFLEHKMFDMENGDAADEFAKLGASSNAFTSSSRTAYLFSTTTNENDCVELLLDFVQSLNITDESVEKEKGIICQEIKMYDDDPDWRVYFGAIANLYHKHPVKIDIAGTCETVNNTYKDMLELCYQTFYHPHNMMLFVVGNINPEKLIDVIKENQNKKHFLSENAIQRLKIEEPTSVAVKEQIDTMQVEMNKLIVSIKINEILDDPQDKIKRELSLNLLFYRWIHNADSITQIRIRFFCTINCIFILHMISSAPSFYTFFPVNNRRPTCHTFQRLHFISISICEISTTRQSPFFKIFSYNIFLSNFFCSQMPIEVSYCRV